MRFRLVPSDRQFFRLFSDAAQNMQECAAELRTLLASDEKFDAAHDAVRAHEKKGDSLTRDLLQRLETTFVTPFDREDIHQLTEEIDDVVDEMHDVAALLFLLPRATPPMELLAQCDVLIEITRVAVDLIARLDGLNGVNELLEEIHTLESSGDTEYRKALSRLFSGEFEAIDILRWKDIVEGVENAIDHVEDMADVVESIVVKYA